MEFSFLIGMILFWYNADILMLGVNYEYEMVEERRWRKKRNISSNFVFFLKRYKFDIVLYGNKLTKITIVYFMFCSMPKNAECWHGVIAIDIDMIDIPCWIVSRFSNLLDQYILTVPLGAVQDFKLLYTILPLLWLLHSYSNHLHFWNFANILNMTSFNL